jgi:alpha-L-glutamate ligase-like protein
MNVRSLADRWRALAWRRRAVVGVNRRNVELIYPNNPRRLYPLADDKLLTKDLLSAAGVPVPETLVVCDGLFAVSGTLTELEDREHFVVKPARGSRGEGILVVGERLGPGRWRGAGSREVDRSSIRTLLADIVFGAYSKDLEDRAFVERRIVAHETFRRLWPNGLCDVRIITLEGTPVVAMARVPTARSGGRANLHQGGIGLAIDLVAGRSLAAVAGDQMLERHPDSGCDLIGLHVPAWPTVLDVARRAAQTIALGYLGIDLVVDEHEGPLVLEVNARPGLEIQNIHGRGLGEFLAAAGFSGEPAHE